MARPIRVAFVAYRGNMACGGQGVYLWFLSRELARQGIEVDVFVGPPYPDPMPFARRLHPLPNRQFWGHWFGKNYSAMIDDPAWSLLSPLNFYELASSRLGFLPEPFAFSLRAFRSMAAQIRQGASWDLVHDVQCLGYGLLGIRALGLPVVTTIHHPLSVDRRASFMRDNDIREAVGTMKFYPIGMQSFVARRIDRVLTSSESSAMRIIEDFGVAPSRVTNVWNGLDTELYSPSPEVPRDALEILCVGRANDPNKGIRTLIEAMAKLPKDVTLTLVDSDHPQNPVFSWARLHGVGKRLRVTGYLPTHDLVQHYRRAALVVVPSRYEGFGLPAVEAMACGTAVVATQAGALGEVMRLVGGGDVVVPDQPELLAKALGEMLENPERRALLGERARRRIENTLSWPRVARSTAEAYAEVIEERRGRPESTMTSATPG